MHNLVKNCGIKLNLELKQDIYRCTKFSEIYVGSYVMVSCSENSKKEKFIVLGVK